MIITNQQVMILCEVLRDTLETPGLIGSLLQEARKELLHDIFIQQGDEPINLDTKERDT